MVCRPQADATDESIRKGRPLSMSSEKLLRPNVRTIETNTTLAEVERGEGEARSLRYPENHYFAVADVCEAR
jgi:hypothetical protein